MLWTCLRDNRTVPDDESGSERVRQGDREREWEGAGGSNQGHREKRLRIHVPCFTCGVWETARRANLLGCSYGS